jgi:hypothetical protein
LRMAARLPHGACSLQVKGCEAASGCDEATSGAFSGALPGDEKWVKIAELAASGGWLNPRRTESGSRTDSRVYVTAHCARLKREG